MTATELHRTTDTDGSQKRDVLVAVGLGVLLTAASYALALAFGWLSEVNAGEAFAVLTSYSCTYLCVKQRRFNYVFGALSTAAYCIVFWQQGLYASMALNAYLAPTLVYGWFRWRADADARPVTRLRPGGTLLHLGIALAAFAGAFAMNSALGGAFAATDSLILVGTILAQLLMVNKKLENWIVWFIVDIVATWQYFASGLPLVGIQYALFLLNAVWGFFEWRRSMSAGRTR